ncbi:MAG: ABC transporter ATP-binding protein [Ruminiclostridium sp.]|nr:ABC transporter ATP-binding protein [Ruminiclostridium sp.]
MENTILSVKDLTVSFKTDSGTVHSVRGVSFDLKKGETLAVVGESGSGKSVTAKSILGINPRNTVYEGGSIEYKGDDLLAFSDKAMDELRGNEISMIFQDPLSSLDPVMRIGDQLMEAIKFNNISRCRNAAKAHKIITKALLKAMEKAGCADTTVNAENAGKAIEHVMKGRPSRTFLRVMRRYADMDRESFSDPAAAAETLIKRLNDKMRISTERITKAQMREKAIAALRDVGIKEPEKRLKQYPHEFSGGMRQRIVIAIALSSDPEILICDEPTTALDVTVQAQILELIDELKVRKNISVLFITHNLGVVAEIADRVAVMYAGKIVEYGTAHEIFYDPKHPYTWALLSSVPTLDSKERLESIPGSPPDMRFPPKGDAFAARNKYALELDFELQPPMFKVTDSHYAATWLLHPEAPKPELPEQIKQRNLKYDPEVSGR